MSVRDGTLLSLWWRSSASPRSRPGRWIHEATRLTQACTIMQSAARLREASSCVLPHDAFPCAGSRAGYSLSFLSFFVPSVSRRYCWPSERNDVSTYEEDTGNLPSCLHVKLYRSLWNSCPLHRGCKRHALQYVVVSAWILPESFSGLVLRFSGDSI